MSVIFPNTLENFGGRFSPPCGNVKIKLDMVSRIRTVSRKNYHPLSSSEPKKKSTATNPFQEEQIIE